MSERDARAYLARMGQPMPEPTRKGGVKAAMERAGIETQPGDFGSDLERALADAIHAAGLPRPERELMLVPGRKFQCDFVWRDARLIVEVEGGTMSGNSRHSKGEGFNSDCVKYNTLTLMGYRVIRVTGPHIASGDALRWIEWGLESVPTD